AVNGFTEQVEYSPERCEADRHCHGFAGVLNRHASRQTISRAERDCANAVAAEVLLHLPGESNVYALGVGIHLECVVDLRKMAFLELDVKRRADHLHDFAVFQTVLTGNHSLSSKATLSRWLGTIIPKPRRRR